MYAFPLIWKKVGDHLGLAYFPTAFIGAVKFTWDPSHRCTYVLGQAVCGKDADLTQDLQTAAPKSPKAQTVAKVVD